MHAALIGVLLIAGPAFAQAPAFPGAVSAMPLPGGIRAALEILGDPVAPDRSQFLVEIIRRTYRSSVATKDDPREAALRPLLAHLDAAARSSTPDKAADTLPLPLPASIWIEAIFNGRATPRTLAAAILASRGASLLYCGLLSLDDDTRAWFAGKPRLLSDLASRHAAGFMTAAPGVRIAGGTVRVPGGTDAEPAWAALVGRSATDAESFVRALVSEHDGILAYFFASVAQLAPAEIRRMLDLDSPDSARRVESTRRMFAIYDRLAPGWKVDERTFWRPALDPALLVADPPVDDRNVPVVYGSQRFWAAVFADSSPSRSRPGRSEDEDTVADGQPVDLTWIAEQIFQGDQAERRRRYEMVLFASRMLRAGAADGSQQAIDAVRAAGTYPALVAALERAGLTDLAVYAKAADRAARLSSINDEARAVRALAQFQGALALVARAARRGSLSAHALGTLVTSLSAVETSDRGDYEARLVRWLDTELLSQLTPSSMTASDAADADGGVQESAAGPVERDMLRLIAGARPGTDARFVDWEGTRYRVDIASAESVRISRLIGENPRPYLSSARTIAGVADAIAEARVTRDALRRDADMVEQLAQAVAWERCRDVAVLLQRAARDGDVGAAPHLVSALRLLADDLLARGLKELTYAAAMGQPERAPIAADTAASRHDFGRQSLGSRHTGPWRLPVPGGDPVRGWRVTGSLLGLDVRLSEFALVRLSTKPPKRRPTLNDEDRRALVESVALVDPALLTDTAGDAIASAMRAGRARLAAVRTPEDASALADAIRLSPTRRTLLRWMVAHDRARVAAFLSPSELLWLGLDGAPPAPALQAWGAPGEARLGCLCVQLMNRRPFEPLAGRWGSGIFASGFADLNLRLAELLADMQMPATLLGPVLASATLDFVNSAISRDEDDRRGLVEFVQAIGRERLEEYLALLTTDGPLVPVSETTGRTAHPGVSR